MERHDMTEPPHDRVDDDGAAGDAADDPAEDPDDAADDPADDPADAADDPPDDPADDLSCEELVELVTDYLDGALDRDTEARFVLHATSCPGCETYLRQFRDTIAAIGTLQPEALDEQVRENLLEAFRVWRA
jgi:hypothetical protein